VFGKIRFFRDWPYILPTAITGAIGLAAALSSALFLEETLNKDALQNKSDQPKMSTWQLLKHRGVPTAIATFSWASMLGFAFTAICPVYFYTSVPLGGFGLPEKLISLFISLNGIAQALWLLIAFPPLHKRFGTKRLLQVCGIFWPIFMVFFPINNFFLRQHWKATFWAVAPTVQVIGSGVAIAFTACQLAVNEAAPSPELLGTLNGVALTIQPGVRAITPALFSSIYAVGVKKHILGGQLGILILTLLAGGFFFVASTLPDQGRKTQQDDTENQEHVNGSIITDHDDRRD
jgi:Na+/melibiose symporter-like transporter